MSTLTVRPTSYTAGVDYSAFIVTDSANIYDGFDGTCGTLAMPGSTLNEGYDIAFQFDCSALPKDAVVSAVDFTWTGKTNYADRFINVWIQARQGSALKGSSESVSDSGSLHTATLTGLSYTYEELAANLNLLFHSDHGGNTNVGYYYLYDVYAVITYSAPQELKIRQDGSWAAANAVYQKENGAWTRKTDLTGVFSTSKRYRKRT